MSRRRSRFPTAVLATFCALLPTACVVPEDGAVDPSTLATRAERTEYRETTRYDEVVEFMEAVAATDESTASGPRLHLTTFGYTYEGRALPMIVFGDVDSAAAEAVRASGKTRIWVQGNIHGGEVCGKEAMLMLLRALAQGEHADWADSLVVMIAPIYNADGNERVEIDNRPRQHGPLAGMGQRPNAQGYDLNRDHMKLDSPEARSLVLMMREYDPHVAIDLHTTNGTQHAYHVTYSPPLHPNTPAGIDDLLRREWLPAVTRAINDKHGWDYYYYGNASGGRGGFGGPPPGAAARGGRAGGGRGAPGAGQGGAAAGGRGAPGAGGRGTAAQGRGGRGGQGGPAREPGWYTFDHRPRFNNNYVGLRNRFAILSEAYAYATFEERVLASLWFVEEILDWARDHADRIRDISEQADAESIVGRELAVRAEPQRSAEPVEILMGEVGREINPYSGATILRRLDVSEPVTMYEYGTFQPTATEVAPATYLVPPQLGTVVEKLRAHGVELRPLDADRTLNVEEFVITSSTAAPRPFQGHNERTLEGSWRPVERTVPAGTLVVDAAQPLGRLAFYLLEPRSDDGLANWNFLDDALEGTGIYPILRTGESLE